MRTFLALTIVASAVSVGTAADIKSGLQVGDYPAAFYVADITGPAAGTKLCYRCRYGAKPVVNIFARKMDANVAKLVKELDAVVAKNKDSEMSGFVVVLTDKPDAQEAELKKVAEQHSIKPC